MNEGTQTGGAHSVWTGIAAGALIGVAEAWIQTTAQPGWGLQAFGVAVLTDGALGGLAGALWQRVRHSGPGRTTALALSAAAAVALGAGFAFAPSAPPFAAEQGDDASPVDVVWIAVNGLRSDALDRPELAPNLAALTHESLWWPRAWSPSASPDLALASAVTGRLPDGHGAVAGAPLPDDVPTIAEAIARWKIPTRAVLQSDASFGRGFGEVVRPRPARVLGFAPPTAGLLFWRAVDALVGPKGPERAIGDEATILSAVTGWAAASEPLGFVFIELNGTAAPLVDAAGQPGDPDEVYGALLAQTDAQIGDLLAALKGRKAAVFVSGTVGRALHDPPDADAAQALTPGETRVPWIARLTDGPRDARIATQVSTAAIGPSIIALMDASENEVWDGEPQLRKATRAGMLVGSIRCGATPTPGCLPELPPLTLPWPDLTEEAPYQRPETPPTPAPAPLTTPGVTPEQAAAAMPPPPERAPEPKPERPVLGVAPGTQLILDPNQHNPCDMLTSTFGRDAVFAVRTEAEGGAYLVVREGGYALHLPGAATPTASSEWRLFDLKHDPEELGRTVARDALTCGDVLAKDRAEQMITRLASLLDASQKGHDRDLPTGGRPRRNNDMPDPTRP
jgi:hypothetical protein